MELAMPVTDAVVLAAICLAFIGFGLILAWGEYQTRNLHSKKNEWRAGK